MNNLLTRRATPTFRLEPDGKRLSWYACLFDTPTLIDFEGVPYTEVIRAGAFDTSLAADTEVVANLNHDDKYIFARRSDGSLLLQADPKGLFSSCWVEGEIAQRVLANPEEWGASFRFLPVESRSEGGTVERLQVQLADVCLTRTPAYPDTIGEVHVRGKDNKERVSYLLSLYQYTKNRWKWTSKN